MSFFGLVSKSKYNNEIKYIKDWYAEKVTNLFGKNLFDYNTFSGYIKNDIVYDIPKHVIDETREELNINEKQMSLVICDFFSYMLTIRYFLKNDMKQNIPIFPISSKATDILWKNFMTTEEYIDFCQKHIGKYIPRTVGNKYLIRKYNSSEKHYILKAVEENKSYFMYRHHVTQNYLSNNNHETPKEDDFLTTYLTYSLLFNSVYYNDNNYSTNSQENNSTLNYSDYSNYSNCSDSSFCNHDTHSSSNSSYSYDHSYSDSSCGSSGGGD